MKAKKVYEVINESKDCIIDPRFGINISKKELADFLDDPTEDAITVGDETKPQEYSKVAYKDKNGVYIFLTRDEAVKYNLQKQVTIDAGTDFGKEYKFYIFKNNLK